MTGRDDKLVRTLGVIENLQQRGIRHFATHPKMSLRYFTEALTQIRALVKSITMGNM